MTIIDRLLSFLGSTVKTLLIVFGSLVALLIVVAVLMPDSGGKGDGKEQSDSLKTELRQVQSIASDVMDQNDVMSGEDFTTVDAASRSNKDAVLDVAFDEQSTVVFGE
jgi:hypothetical protein